MQYKEKVEQIHQDLHSRTNDQKDFVGWLNLPTNYDKEEFERIKKSAQKIQKRFRSFNCNRNWWIIFRSKSSY